MIVVSAEQAAATVSYSEDLNTGQSMAGVTIVTPLLATSPPLPASVTPTAADRTERGTDTWMSAPVVRPQDEQKCILIM